MKNQTLKIIFALCLLGATISCSKDESSSPAPTKSNAFNVTVNGTIYSTDTANFDVEGNIIQIYATKNAYTKSVLINIAGLTTGTYNFATNTNAIFTEKTGSGLFDYESYSSTKGTVILSSVDTATSITGTFQFTAFNINDPTDSLVFSNGTFTLPREN